MSNSNKRETVMSVIDIYLEGFKTGNEILEKLETDNCKLDETEKALSLITSKIFTYNNNTGNRVKNYNYHLLTFNFI